MLVSAKEMLQKAKAGHYAVGQFNINNLEWTKAILLTAEECKSPVILGVSEGAGKYMAGYKTVVGMVNGMLEELKITVPVALHLDHGSYDGCMKCIEAGFSSIMFDGSHFPIEENVEKTKELVAIVNEKGMSLEAEVGAIGGEEDGVVGKGECADPDECKRIADLGIDFLAAGIGDPEADRGHASGTSRRYRNPGGHDQEGDLSRRCKDQCKYRVPAFLCGSDKRICRSRKGPGGQGIRSA